MEQNVLSLYELNRLVRNVLEDAFDQSYWIQAELSDVGVNRTGHCYVDFVQKAPKGNAIIARARGTIWANVYALLAPYFEQQTGQRFAAGIKVLVKVEVNYHEAYGFSLNVIDIDPTYTLGDLARRRQEILRQLEEEGVLTLNKELEMPVLPQRVAVISAATAAGYGDFCNQLFNNPKGFVFYPKLFPAVMQGEQTEKTIISALNVIAEEQEKWDVVVIIRGGGATSDLASFDTYLLAANVAQFPLPIITGIGHERDDTVLDMISHTRVKTPTAAAEFLIDRIDESACKLEELAQRMAYLIEFRRVQEERKIDALWNSVEQIVQRRITQGEHTIQLLQQRLRMALPMRLERENHKLNLVSQRIQDNSPERLLKRGYSLTLKDGKVVKDASQLKSGDVIETRLGTGNVESTVK
ncbi:MAG: exodeoxyribonuclease VII large subunit [Bacteroidales bacterium]|nr:exodeoxyribonuclease VII large subunit [Candidatus Minthousia equi]